MEEQEEMPEWMIDFSARFTMLEFLIENLYAAGFSCEAKPMESFAQFKSDFLDRMTKPYIGEGWPVFDDEGPESQIMRCSMEISERFVEKVGNRLEDALIKRANDARS